LNTSETRGRPRTRKFYERNLRKIDPCLKDEDMLTALILLIAICEVGPWCKPIAKFLGTTEWQVRKRAKYLREQGVWDKKGHIYGDYLDEETGAVAFWLDVLVADGILVVADRKDEKGRNMYRRRSTTKSKTKKREKEIING